jgi:hypothetical protein
MWMGGRGGLMVWVAFGRFMKSIICSVIYCRGAGAKLHACFLQFVSFCCSTEDSGLGQPA